jgi:hypothetical protein
MGLIYHNDPNLDQFQKLIELAKPNLDKYDSEDITLYDQPHHNVHIPQIFKENDETGVFVTELPIYLYDGLKNMLVTGHIDGLKIIGKTIYIMDYKPEYDLDLDDPSSVANPFADCTPQIGAYALIFREMFKDILNKFGYEIRCVTYNNERAISWNPEKCLAAYTAFYEIYKPNEGDPPWKFLVSEDLVELYKEAYL